MTTPCPLEIQMQRFLTSKGTKLATREFCQRWLWSHDYPELFSLEYDRCNKCKEEQREGRRRLFLDQKELWQIRRPDDIVQLWTKICYSCPKYLEHAFIALALTSEQDVYKS